MRVGLNTEGDETRQAHRDINSNLRNKNLMLQVVTMNFCQN